MAKYASVLFKSLFATLATSTTSPPLHHLPTVTLHPGNFTQHYQLCSYCLPTSGVRSPWEEIDKKKGEECKQTPPTYWRNQSVGFWMVLSGHPACSSQIVAPEAKRRAHPSTQNTQQVNIPTSLKEVGLSKTLAANPTATKQPPKQHIWSINNQAADQKLIKTTNLVGGGATIQPSTETNQTNIF